MLAISAHFTFMNNNQPAACFVDAYQADIKVGNTLWAAAKAMFDSGGQGDLSAAMPAREAFLANLDSYFADCK